MTKLPFLLATVVLLAAPIAAARADGPAPAVSAVNGKISGEGGATGIDGDSSGLAIAKGSLTTPLGHDFGLQLDGMAGTAFNATFGGGTAHVFWRDPSIGLVGPVASLSFANGIRLGWYGAEAELYAGIFSFGAWGGYHEVAASAFGVNASSGFYGGSVTVYPTPDLALSLGATSAFNRVTSTGTLEFQPDLLARRNVSFFVSGEVAQDSAYTVTAGIRFYFGPDKPLIRRHREDDPSSYVLANPEVLADAAAQLSAIGANAFMSQLP